MFTRQRPRISVILRSWNRYILSLNRILIELTGNFDNLTSNICQHWLIVNHILPLESPWSGITPLKDPWPYLFTFLDTKYGFFENFESIEKFQFWKYGKSFWWEWNDTILDSLQTADQGESQTKIFRNESGHNPEINNRLQCNDNVLVWFWCQRNVPKILADNQRPELFKTVRKWPKIVENWFEYVPYGTYGF